MDYSKNLTYLPFCCILSLTCWTVQQISRYLMTKDELLEQYMDVQQAGQRLNIHPESVRRLIRQGKIPAIRFSNKWLIQRDVLEQFASRYDPRPGQKATLL